jgi:sugar lactone lactonase YvrE
MHTRSISALILSPLFALLAGCASMTNTAPTEALTSVVMQGSVHGGQQPINGAHIYLMAVGSTGYGTASVSKLNVNASTLNDSIGNYVLSNANGTFSITGDYSCDANTQLYLYTLGGNPGSGSNPAAGLLAALGTCPTGGSFLPAIPFVAVNEVSTVAAAYSLAGFAVDATHIASSGSTLAVTDVANAFLTPANLASISTGFALTTTPAGNGTVPAATINTLANILAACINSNPSTSTTCSTLFGAALSGGTTGTTPTDTATAAINIAHNPAANVATLFGLATASPQFAPTLSTRPNDFNLGVTYTGAGKQGTQYYGAVSLAIDAAGQVWFVNGNSTVSELSPAGAPLSPATGFTGSGFSYPQGIAIDPSGNAWVADFDASTVVKLSPTGAATTYTGGGLNRPFFIAIDGAGDVWTTNYGNNTVSEFNNSGGPLSSSAGDTAGGLSAPQGIAINNSGDALVASTGSSSIQRFGPAGMSTSGANGYTGGGLNAPSGIAIDRSNNIWVGNNNPGANSISEFTAGGTPVSATGYTGGGVNQPTGIAIDGAGNLWVTNQGGTLSVSELTNAGVPVSPATGYQPGNVGTPQLIAVDGSGNVWITTNSRGGTTNVALVELIGAAVPAVRPLSAGSKAGTLGTRP